MSKETNYSWDTGVFLAWLCDEVTSPLADISSVIEEIETKKANLIVSVIVYAEILTAKNGVDVVSKFRGFLRRSNVDLVDMTLAVAEKAEEIRSRAILDGRKIKLPDATIVATAILRHAHVLHALDDGLLSLNEKPIVDGLKIIPPKPFSGQGSFFASPIPQT
jgi:predicted nucleic acid-binding protein